MNDILQIKSISEMHQLLEIEKPAHPLISVVSHTKDMNLSFGKNLRVNNHLYFISLKENMQGAFQYGRKSYDFQEGSLVFMRPKQITSNTGNIESDLGGWSIFFHPDLIRAYSLSNTIQHYSFFDYDSNEALHISEKGIPSVKECGENLEMSGKYLGDLLKKETGKSITEHIHLHIVEKAKNELLNSNNPISQIAYGLGFEYPQHFSKIFKSNAGVTPKQFRSLKLHRIY
jgi:AraC-like DNA-binding protein